MDTADLVLLKIIICIYRTDSDKTLERPMIYLGNSVIVLVYILINWQGFCSSCDLFMTCTKLKCRQKASLKNREQNSKSTIHIHCHYLFWYDLTMLIYE